ncbi:DUF2219 family protein [Maribacter sp. MJ134]|uniref:lipid A-modifier LpxR family protein n=1 Tax=Maribacter sp. MJ134 TaxID=2496865 RepID=UPI000F81B892|nr:lipid A-modifier LpxR family protein [Maribacter sp. MJ134]AZQ60142.1 DUF2219 family protein [Maribacter sp. MJ134]
MLNNSILFWSLCIWCVLAPEAIISQGLADNSGPSHQIEFRHDNDFLFLTDRYYSSGLFITYRTLLNKGFLKKGEEQLSFSLSQEVYTPSQTQATNPEVFDIPYAGFSGLTASWSVAKENELISASVLLGVAGPNSGAGGFQRWFHNVVDISESPLWIDELPNSFHANLYFSQIKEWNISSAPLGILFAFKSNLALGTRDIYIEPEGIFYFGKRNELPQSIAYDRIRSVDREIYVGFRFSYRQVFHNGLLEGNLINNNAAFTTPATNSVLRLGLDFNNRFKRSDVKFGIRYNTAESPLAKAHKYIILAYGYRF